MKKYNTPTIEALALETVDVMATSGNKAAVEALAPEYQDAAAKNAMGGIDKEFQTAADLATSGWAW